MNHRISRLWREPILHFLLIGAALFVYYDIAREGGNEAPNRIYVSGGQIQQLVANFERTWSRPPLPSEIDGLIESHVREEVFYREALAMGLDQNDPLVRRRMRMKLEFILEDLATQDVEDEILNDYMQRHQDQFRQDTQVSLRLVYLNPELRPQLEGDARQLLTLLNSGADPQTLGDPTMAPAAYQQARQSEVARDFGVEFARQVAQQPLNKWIGPVYSPFGAHLINIDARIDDRLPALTEIRETVLREYLAEQREQQKDFAYQRLRERYAVTIEPFNSDTGAQ